MTAVGFQAFVPSLDMITEKTSYIAWEAELCGPRKAGHFEAMGPDVAQLHDGEVELEQDSAQRRCEFLREVRHAMPANGGCHWKKSALKVCSMSSCLPSSKPKFCPRLGQ